MNFQISTVYVLSQCYSCGCAFAVSESLFEVVKAPHKPVKATVVEPASVHDFGCVCGVQTSCPVHPAGRVTA